MRVFTEDMNYGLRGEMDPYGAKLSVSNPMLNRFWGRLNRLRLGIYISATEITDNFEMINQKKK